MALALVPLNNLEPRGDATAKAILEAAILIASRYKSEKSDKLPTGTKQLRNRNRQMKGNGTLRDNIEHFNTMRNRSFQL